MFRRQTNQVLLISIMSVRLLVIFLVILQTAIAIVSYNDTQKIKILSYFEPIGLPDTTVCGLEKEGMKILGGEVTDLGEFPWVAALEYKSKRSGKTVGIKCGGSLITSKYVLTAAHCVSHKEFDLIAVRLGDWNTTSDPDCETLGAVEECADEVQKLKVTEKISHPFYKREHGTSDIALLRLEHTVVFTKYVRPICLPPPNSELPEYGIFMTVAGWGATRDTERTDEQSDVMLKVKVPLLPNTNCSRRYIEGVSSRSQLCAGGIKGKDSCQGDSGGPLMIIYEDARRQTRWYLEGVVSYGQGCGREGTAAVYTRVSRFVGWIMNNIAEN